MSDFTMKTLHQLFGIGKISLLGCIALLDLVGHTEQASATVLHSYGNAQGQEVINVIAVEQEKLYSLLPEGYQIVPAASLGFGGAQQGIVAIANFRGFGPTVDGMETNDGTQVAIDVGILVTEPSDAAKVGLDIPGTFHLYTLQIYTNDAEYAASLQSGGMPVELVEDIEYERNMDDASGVGDLFVNVPSNDSPLMTLSSGQGYFPVPGAFNFVLWADRDEDKVALHFLDSSVRQGNAIGQVFTQSQTRWNSLLDGGGLGSCPTVPEPGYDCIIAPSVNLRYDAGTRGELILVNNTSVPEPEPLTMLGAGTALGFGAFFKRKLAKAKESNNS